MRLYNRHIVYTAAFLMDVVYPFALGAAAVYAVEMGASAIELGYIGASGSFLYALSSIIGGKLCDRFSRKAIIIVNTVFAGVSCYLLFLSTSVWQLCLYFGLFYGFLGFFWPPIQALIADSTHRKDLITTLSNFCLSWSFGLSAGHLVCGYLTRSSAILPFFWGVVICAVILVLTFSLSDSEGKARSGSEDFLSRSDSPARNAETWKRFIWCAWLSNFALVFVIGSIKMIFPKLALEVDHMDRSVLGILLALIHAGQMIMFWVVRYWHGWQYNRKLYLLFQIVTLPGTLLLAVTGNVFLYGAAMVLIGVSGGFSYTASIYYSTSCPPGSANRTGIHESMIGLASLAGPLICGYVASAWNLHAPYIACTAVVLAAILLQAWLLYRPESNKAPEA